MNFFSKNKNIFTSSLLLTFLIPFSFAFAANNTTDLGLTDEYSDNPSKNEEFQIVPKCTEEIKDSKGNLVGYQCGWKNLLQLVRNIMSLLLFLSASIAVLAFMYAGFTYLTAFGDMGKVEKAHGIFSKVMVGFLFVFLGWLIVATVLTIMGVNDGFSFLNTSGVKGLNDS